MCRSKRSKTGRHFFLGALCHVAVYLSALPVDTIRAHHFAGVKPSAFESDRLYALAGEKFRAALACAPDDTEIVSRYAQSIINYLELESTQVNKEASLSKCTPGVTFANNPLIRISRPHSCTGLDYPHDTDCMAHFLYFILTLCTNRSYYSLASSRAKTHGGVNAWWRKRWTRLCEWKIGMVWRLSLPNCLQVCPADKYILQYIIASDVQSKHSKSKRRGTGENEISERRLLKKYRD